MMTQREKATSSAEDARVWAEGDPDAARHMLGLRGDTPHEIVAMVAEEEARSTVYEQEAVYAQERVLYHRDRWDDPEMLSAHIEKGVGQKENSILSLFKSTAVLAEDPVPETSWYLPGLLPKGAFVQLTGSTKGSGKTTFLLHGCDAILNKKTFLDEQTEYTPIVYLTEQSRSSFEAEYLTPIGLMGRNDFHVLNGFQTHGFGYEEIVGAALEKCRLEGAGILAVDTFLYWARVQDENNSSEMQKALRSLQDAAASGLTVPLVHHDRKGGGDTIEAGRGSSAFPGAVDLIINLRRTQGHARTARELRCEGRYSGLYNTLMIELTEDGYEARGSRSDVTQQKAEKVAKEALPTNEGAAISIQELVDAVIPDGVGRTACQRAIDLMANRGEVQIIGKGVRGDPYRYYLPLERHIDVSTNPVDEQSDPSEMLSAQYSITTGQKENGVGRQGFLWDPPGGG